MKYSYDVESKAGCLAVIVVIAVVLGLALAVDLIMTKIVIWIADGLFNCDWSDKFWHVFVALIIIPMIFNMNISVGKK